MGGGAMLSFLKPKIRVEQPVEFQDGIKIEKPAQEVYALLDWADPRNAHRARGSEVAPVEDVPGRFRMTMSELPGHLFEMEVTSAIPHASYGFTTVVTPRFGRMVRSHEQYSIEHNGPESCRLALVNQVNFIDRMRAEEFELEWLMVTTACHNALAKLKLQAEQGVEAVRAVADRIVI